MPGTLGTHTPTLGVSGTHTVGFPIPRLKCAWLVFRASGTRSPNHLGPRTRTRKGELFGPSQIRQLWPTSWGRRFTRPSCGAGSHAATLQRRATHTSRGPRHTTPLAHAMRPRLVWVVWIALCPQHRHDCLLRRLRLRLLTCHRHHRRHLRTCAPSVTSSELPRPCSRQQRMPCAGDTAARTHTHLWPVSMNGTNMRDTVTRVCRPPTLLQ